MSENMQKPAQSKGGIRLTSEEARLPNSTKVYVTNTSGALNSQNAELRVPFREIALSPSRNMRDELEENPPVRVYDTSGPWTDPEQRHNVRDGLPALRRD